MVRRAVAWRGVRRRGVRRRGAARRAYCGSGVVWFGGGVRCVRWRCCRKHEEARPRHEIGIGQAINGLGAIVCVFGAARYPFARYPFAFPQPTLASGTATGGCRMQSTAMETTQSFWIQSTPTLRGAVGARSIGESLLPAITPRRLGTPSTSLHGPAPRVPRWGTRTIRRALPAAPGGPPGRARAHLFSKQTTLGNT